MWAPVARVVAVMHQHSPWSCVFVFFCAPGDDNREVFIRLFARLVEKALKRGSFAVCGGGTFAVYVRLTQKQH